MDTFAGTAKRVSQRILASEAACHEDYIIASLDIDKAFLKGFTYRELAEATGEKERTVCFTLPPGSAQILRQFDGYQDYDESIHCMKCIKPGTGTKDAPRAFSMKLRRVTETINLRSTSYDPEFEVAQGLLTAKHVDDINMAGTEEKIDRYQTAVERTFGPCKIHKHSYVNCAIRYFKDPVHGNVTLDQDEYIKKLRPIVSPELTGAPAEAEATTSVTNQFVSLRGALAYALLTQFWLIVYVVSLQRVQKPTNLDVRRLNAVTRKLQQKPQKLIYPSMKCVGKVDCHADSGYRRVTSLDEIQKGYGMRGMNLLRCGDRKGLAHLIDSIGRSHRLTIRSSYAGEALAVSHGFEDAYPTIVTLHEVRHGILTAAQLKELREVGGLKVEATFTTDAESVFKSLTSRDWKVPTEKTLLGHICWLREMLSEGLIKTIRWCDTRDMTADGHTKGSIDRQLLLDAMAGKMVFRFEVKTYEPYRGSTETQQVTFSQY